MAAQTEKSFDPGSTSEQPTRPTLAPPGTLRSFFLQGPAGRLEALLNEGRSNPPYAVLLCHPHPKGGGTMHNKVVYHAAKVFSGLGWPVLRFNFRGTGLSEGEHHGRDEVNDVRAALDWFSKEYDRPIVAAGFSFGAAMGLEAAASFRPAGEPGLASGIQGFAALGLPAAAEGRHYTYPFLPNCAFPKLFLSGDHDQYSPVEELRNVVATAPQPATLALIAGADHFFVGHLQAMQTALGEWLRGTYPDSPLPSLLPETLAT